MKYACVSFESWSIGEPGPVTWWAVYRVGADNKLGQRVAEFLEYSDAQTFLTWKNGQ